MKKEHVAHHMRRLSGSLLGSTERIWPLMRADKPTSRRAAPRRSANRIAQTGRGDLKYFAYTGTLLHPPLLTFHFLTLFSLVGGASHKGPQHNLTLRQLIVVKSGATLHADVEK